MANKLGQLTDNFHINEFKCNDGNAVPNGLILNCLLLARNLQVLRDEVGPLKINSGYRTAIYNHSIGGAKNSQHLYAKAADIVSDIYSPAEIHEKIERLISEGKMSEGGLGLYKSFVHYDVRGIKARW